MAVPQPASCPGDSVHLEELPARRDLPGPIRPAVRPARHVGDVRRRRRADRPDGVLVEAVNPVVLRHARSTTLVDERFTTVFTDDVATLAYRNDLATWLRSPPVDPVAVAPHRRPRPGAPEVLDDEGCVRLDGDIVSDSTRTGRVSRSASARPPSVGGVTPTITFARTGDDSVVVTSRGTVGSPFAVTLGAAPTERDRVHAGRRITGGRARHRRVDRRCRRDGRGAR